MKPQDIVKDWITDGAGLIVFGLACYLLYCKEIEFFPGFCGMMVVFGVLFYIPDEWVTKHLKQWIKKKFEK